MNTIADQAQMDELLKVLSPKYRKNFYREEPPPRQFVQTYDFRNRGKLSKETRRILERIHDSYATEAAVHLNNTLRANIRIQLNSVKQYALEEYYQILQNPTSIYVFNLSPQKRNIVFEIRNTLSFYILDRLLGGPGSTNDEDRELTKIERKIVQNVVDYLIKIFQTTWEKTAGFKMKLQNYLTSSDYLQFVRRGDSVVTINYKMSFNEKIHLNNVFNITYPYLLIEELIPVIEQEDRENKRPSSIHEVQFMRNSIENIFVPVSIDLGKSNLSVNEVMKLQKGDVLLLDTHVKGLLDLQIGNKVLFKGTAGQYKNKTAFKILDKL